MNIFEYLTRNCKVKPYFDEAGNIYVDVTEGLDRHINIFMQRISEDSFFLVKEDYEKFATIEISLTDDINVGIWNVRRPYFRLRGKSVTKEQAFEIIRRVDRFFTSIDDITSHDDFINCLNFRCNIIPNDYFGDVTWGWIHTDGFVGVNDFTFKYPKENEFVVEWVKYLAEFPFLDLMIVITNWDEIPPEVWYKMFDELSYTCKYWDADDEYNEAFLKAIQFGIHVYDNKIELLNRKEAHIRYIEYDALYGTQKARCSADYNDVNGIFEADLEYVRRCIEAYGFDADDELAKLPERLLKKFDDIVGGDI